MDRRSFCRLAGAGLILPAIIPITAARPYWQDTRTPVIIDADTANEVDDLFAIVRALLSSQLDIRGLSSAQWNTRLSPPNTVLESQHLNEDILRLMGRQDIPAPFGAEMIMGKPWGGEDPSDSPAARFMIRSARRMPAGEKLAIISLGATTNVASAVKLAPDIIPRIKLFALGGKYDADRSVWDKDEFNVRNDLNAANFLFNTEGLELHLMPVNILYDFTWPTAEVEERLSGRGRIWDYLVARWQAHDPAARERILWDLALVQAFLQPQLAREEKRRTPPENKDREIFVYTRIDGRGMRDDWWRKVESWKGE